MPFLPANHPHPDGRLRATASTSSSAHRACNSSTCPRATTPSTCPTKVASTSARFDGQHVYAHDKEPDAGHAAHGACTARSTTSAGPSRGGRCSWSSGAARIEFCGRCATETEPAPPPNDRAMQCPTCGLLAFPRLAPAIIVLVTREERRQSVAGPRRELSRPDVFVPRRLRRAGRDDGARRAPRGPRRGRHRAQGRALLGQPAVAVPALADARFHAPRTPAAISYSTRARSWTRSGTRRTTCR